MARDEGAPSLLAEYVAVLRRRKWFLLAGVIVVPTVALLFSAQQPTTYRAKSQVLLTRQNLANALAGLPNQAYLPGDLDRIAKTQAEIASSPLVAQRALQIAHAIPTVTPSEFLKRAKVTPEQNADILSFEVKDRSAAHAALLARAFGEAYVQSRRQMDTASLQRAEKEVSARIARVNVRDRTTQGLYARLVDKQQQLRTLLALQTNNAAVVKSEDRGVKVSPTPVRNLLLGLVLGVVFGLGAAFLRDTLDTRIRDTEQLEALLGLPLLAEIPRVPAGSRTSHQPVMLSDPHNGPAEAFRMLRTSLAFLLPDGRASIVVTSASAGEGKSTTASNLAIAFARTGKTVILVDGDLRRPVQADRFGLARTPGLAEVITGATSLKSALAVVGIDGIGLDGEDQIVSRVHNHGGSLSVLVSGYAPPSIGECFTSESMARLVDELQQSADIVIFDTPPVLQVNDAIALSGSVGHVLLVTNLQSARRRSLQTLRRTLAQSPAHPLGFALNYVDANSSYTYGSYYYSAQPNQAVKA